MAKAPAPDFSGIFDGLELTPEQMQQVGTLANQLFEGFLQSDQFRALSPEELKDASKLSAAFSTYLENDAAANNAWLSSRPSAAIPWQSVSSRR